MRRIIAPTVLLSAFLVTPAFAQNTGSKADVRMDTTVTQLIGTWSGSVYSDHAPESAIKLTFTKGTSLKVVVSIVSNDQEFVTGESTELKVEGSGITWNLGLMQQSCKGSGVLIAGVLKGDFTCGEFGGITYIAKKK